MKKSTKVYTLIAALTFNISVLYAQDNSVVIKMPKVPEVPKVEAVVPEVIVIGDTKPKSNAEILEEFTREKVVIFSDHVAPEMIEEKDDANKVIEVGDIQNGRVTAYLHAEYMDPKTVEETLIKAGFEVLDSYKQDKKGLVTSVVFTNKEITEMASKKDRGFASTLRITVDKRDNLISISNPIYVMAAFLQDEYDEKLANATLKSLRENFTG